MKYFIGWLKSTGFEIEIRYNLFHALLLWVNFFIKPKEFSISVTFPKYALIITNCDRFYYKNQSYRFMKKKLYKNISFYISHVVGMSATQIDGKEDKWD